MRILVVLIVLLLVGSPTYSQFKVGLKGGGNMVNVAMERSDFLDSNVLRPAFHVGMYGLCYLNEKMLVQADLLFANRGFQSKANNNLDRARVHLNYISLPILFGYQLNEKLSARLGLETSYLLSARSKFDNQVINIGWLWDRKIDVGIACGLNYTATNKVDLGIRYTHGLLNVISSKVQLTDKQGNLMEVGKFKSQNRVFQLSAGYRLN